MSNEFLVAIGQAFIPSTNYCVNPDLETTIAGWTDSNLIGTVNITRTTTDSYKGIASGRIKWLNPSGAGNGATFVANGTYRVPVTTGQVINVAAWVKNVVGTNNVRISIRYYSTDTTLVITTSFNGTPVTNPTIWTQVTATHTVPVGFTGFADVLINTSTSASAGDVILFDEVFFAINEPVVGLRPPPSQVLTVFEGWNLERNFDDGCTFNFSCPGNSIVGTQISELETDIWLYEQSVLVDRFRVIEVTQTWDPDGRDTINVQAVCYRRLLASRHVVSDLTFSGVSQGDIVWGLINHTQFQTNGDLGITVNSLGPTVLRDREYQIGTNILQAITELGSIEDGLAWEIDANLELTVTQPQLFSLKAQPVVLGTNTLTITRPSGASLFANAAIVTGDSISTTTEVLETVSLPIDSRGRWERFQGFPQEQNQTALQEAARGLLQTSVSPAIKWAFELEPSRYFIDSNYQIGDYVLIKKPDSVVPSGANPTVPSYTTVGGIVATQVLTQSISQSPDGEIRISMTAIQVLQRWIDIPSTPVLRWIDVDPSLTWFDLLSELLP